MKTSIVLVCLCATGCSVFDMTRPTTSYEAVVVNGQPKPQSDERCTSTYGNPVADMLIAAGVGGLASYALSRADNATIVSTGNVQQDQANVSSTNTTNAGIAASLAVVSLLYAGSAIYGFNTAGDCEVAKNKLAADRAADVRRHHEAEVFRAQQEKERADDEARRLEIEALRVAQAEKERAEAQAIVDAAQSKACVDSFVRRVDSVKKFDYHRRVQVWLDANCKFTPVMSPHQYIDGNGIVHDGMIQTGTRYSCPFANRPPKMNNDRLTDKNIADHNLATDNDTMTVWIEDVSITKTTCDKFDAQLDRRF